MDKLEILVVEDEQRVLRNLSNAFQARGARVLTAANEAEALEVFHRRASSISAVVTDMRLRGGDFTDRTGAVLAAEIVEAEPHLPVYCNSAIDVSSEYSIFTDYFHKGHDGKHISDFLEDILDSARKFDRDRFSSVPTDLLYLKRKYDISDADFAELVGNRRVADVQSTALLVLHRSLERASDMDARDFATSDESGIIRKIDVVEPIDPRASGVPLRCAAPTVIYHDGGVWIAELFGFPLVYTFGETSESAVRYLVEALYGSYIDIKSGPAKDLDQSSIRSNDMVRFGVFLEHMFGAAA